MSHQRRHPRGSVIILVVALLALLAVIGTVYVVGARSEKNSAAALNVTLNQNLARDAIMNSAIEIMGQRMYGADGRLASYATAGTYGSLPASLYDAPGPTNTPWLAATLHNQSGVDYSVLTTNAFDPSAGTYSLSLTAFPYDATVGALSTVVGDQTTVGNDGTTDDPPTAKSDAYMYLLPFSDASGIRYRYGLRILDTNRMANLNVGSCIDATAIGDTTGIYLTSMRLSPAKNTLPNINAYFNNSDTETNLQATLPANSGEGRAGNSGSNGTFSLSGWQQQMLEYEKPGDTALAFFDLSDELELRAYGEYGTPYHIRPAITPGSGVNYVVWPNTLSANPANPTSGWTTGNPRRRNYTTYSWDRDLRPYPDPATKYTLTPSDGIYASTFQPGTTPAWPLSPAKICANPQTPTTTNGGIDCAFYSALAATNIATLMEFSTAGVGNNGAAAVTSAPTTAFTHEEACAFAANYCTAKWDGFTSDPGITATTAYYLPAGPSFVDTQGICFRTVDSSANPIYRDFGGGSNDLRAEPIKYPQKIYLGYSAQPFFSEVAAYEADDDIPADAPEHTDIKEDAVEIYNPYDVALSLNGYLLKSNDSTINVDLTGQYVPAKGYLVIATSANTHLNIPAGANVYVPNAPQLFPALSSNDGTAIAWPNLTLTLYRPYYVRGSHSKQLAPVDYITYGALTDFHGLPSENNAKPPQVFNISRPGGNSNSASQWSPTVNPATYTRVPASTLAADNGGTVTGWPLPDRYAVTSPPTQGAVFGMGEFARIIRLANEFDGSTSLGTVIPLDINAAADNTPNHTDGGTISDHLANLQTTAGTAPYNAMTTGLQYDAQILFDFYADPRIYSVTPPSDSGIPSGQRHDIRATRLLEQLAFLDRVSDFSIDIGNGVVDINKIRLPGRINVNTASGDVLRAIPNMTNQMVSNILAYRNRSGTGTYPYGLGSSEGVKTSQYDFSDASKFPGKGFHSRAEILVALTAPNSATTIDARDVPWGPICCVSTVRSDTFVVYGYMEAIKAFPGGTHNNGTDWYGTVTDSLQSPATNLRVARRRWVAIVDRSFCNYSKVHPQFQADGTVDPKAGQPDSRYSLPRIVAIKDLPQ